MWCIVLAKLNKSGSWRSQLESTVDTAPTEQAETLPERELSLRFLGTTPEYFRIWIVNVLLTVVTLGIYSAWAKVRNKRYFYGNTLLDDSPFEYHARPIQILKGRLIAVAVLVGFILLSTLNPMLGAVLPIGLSVVAPLMIRQGLRFNSAMSSYRGIRFSFRGSVGEAYVTYLLWPTLAVFTVYLLWPLAHKKASEYRLNHSFFGSSKFETSLKTGRFYSAYFWAVLVAGGLLLVIAVLAAMLLPVLQAVMTPMAEAAESSQKIGPLAVLAQLVAYGFIVLIGLMFRAVMTARTTNHIYGVTQLASRVRFASSLTSRKLAWLYFSNLMAILLTLGLATPWARIRLMRYRVQKTQVFARGSMDEFTAGERKQQSALGEELADVFDVDIGGL